MRRVRAVHIVFANWCPHCVPTTVQPMKKAAEELGVPCVLYDIDTDVVKKADELVRRYGDWSEDYLIPQVFSEFDDGEFKHILTGYSEGIDFTARAVSNLVDSSLGAEQLGGKEVALQRGSDAQQQAKTVVMDLKSIVQKNLGGSLKCYGHCGKQGALRFLPVSEKMVACHTCPSGYVSRIVAYVKDFDLTWFKEFLTELVKGMEEVTDQDIRVATRYPWDLGIEGESSEVVLRQAYWTQSYRRTKSVDPNRIALFLCSKCSSLYLQPLSSKETLCMKCRG